MTFLSQCTKCSLATVSKLLWELFNGFIDRIDWKMTGNEVTWSKWPQVVLESWGQNQLCFRGIPIEHHFSQHTTGTHNFIITVQQELWPCCFNNRRSLGTEFWSTKKKYVIFNTPKVEKVCRVCYSCTMTPWRMWCISRWAGKAFWVRRARKACWLAHYKMWPDVIRHPGGVSHTKHGVRWWKW